MNKHRFKGGVAVIAGFVSVVMLSVGTDFILEAAGVFPPPGQHELTTWMLVLALVYRNSYAVIGGYITAWLAPDRPMRFVTVLGIIGVVAALIGVVVAWELEARWYPIALAVFAFPCTWLGGKIRRSRSIIGDNVDSSQGAIDG